jgi:hypothetical protein
VWCVLVCTEELGLGKSEKKEQQESSKGACSLLLCFCVAGKTTLKRVGHAAACLLDIG